MYTKIPLCCLLLARCVYCIRVRRVRLSWYNLIDLFTNIAPSFFDAKLYRMCWRRRYPVSWSQRIWLLISGSNLGSPCLRKGLGCCPTVIAIRTPDEHPWDPRRLHLHVDFRLETKRPSDVMSRSLTYAGYNPAGYSGAMSWWSQVAFGEPTD